jgi:hypothetical protein
MCKTCWIRCLSSLDLQSVYNQNRIAESNIEKTAFATPCGQYRCKVLNLGLTNAPATFQCLMHRMFAPYIGKFALICFDDILNMSHTPEEHLRHLRLVLELLSLHKLYAKLSKCDFDPQVPWECVERWHSFSRP